MVSIFARKSIDERNVVRMNILHEYPVGLQNPQDRLGLGPMYAELLSLRVLPISHDFLRKVERPIQIAPAKSSTNGRLTTVISMIHVLSSHWTILGTLQPRSSVTAFSFRRR